MRRRMILLLMVLTLGLGLPDSGLPSVTAAGAAGTGAGLVGQHPDQAQAAKRGKRSHKRHKHKKKRQKPRTPPAPTCFGLPATITAVAGQQTEDTPANDVIIGDAGPNTIILRNGGRDRVCGLGGDDTITGELLGVLRPVLADGGSGNDFIIGAQDGDVLFGGTGNDRLVGSGGEDNLFGGDGNDRLFGGAGVDILDGGGDADSCVPDDGLVAAPC